MAIVTSPQYKYPSTYRAAGRVPAMETDPETTVPLPASVTPVRQAAARAPAPTVEMEPYTAPAIPSTPETRAAARLQPEAPSPTKKASEYTKKDIARAGARMAGDFIESETAARGQMASADYARQMQDYKQQGKYWFDPNATLEPDLEAYVAEMPSAVDALSDTTIAGMFGSESKAGHVLSKTGERAATGAIALSELGPVGAIIGGVVGGAIGIVEGFIGWGDAEEQDAKTKRRLTREYQQKLREWQARRAQRISNYNDQLGQRQMQARLAYSKKREAEAEKEKVEKKASASKNRAAIAAAIMQSGQAAAQSRSGRVARWR